MTGSLPYATMTVVPPGTPEGLALLTAYFHDIVSRYHGREATRGEVRAAMNEEPSGNLCPPHGLFLLARRDGAVIGCAGRSAVPSLRLMARFALAGFGDGIGPLSPDVFWWRDGTWAQITKAESDGTISVLPNPDLVHMIQQLDGR